MKRLWHWYWLKWHWKWLNLHYPTDWLYLFRHHKRRFSYHWRKLDVVVEGR